MFITEAKYVKDYIVKVKFDDGVEKLIDLKDHLDGPIFEPLKDVTYFSTVTYDPEIRTVKWENGADFAPEFLYEI
jgi:hypothetical protein